MAGSLVERHSVAAPQHPADGVHGRPYGGSVTLVMLTRWPALFAAGARLAGMSDTLFAGTERWTAPASVADSVQAHQALQALGAPSDHHVELSERIAGWFDRWL